MEAFTGLCLAAVMWSLLCRVYQMDWARTQRIVVFAHALLAMCALGALILPADVSKTVLSAGLALYLLVSSRRWRNGQPEDTRRPPKQTGSPAPMPASALDRVSGGSKPPEDRP